jgi:hypothetical protein
MAEPNAHVRSRCMARAKHCLYRIAENKREIDKAGCSLETT